MELVHGIVSLGKTLGLDVDGADVEELEQEHNEELTTDKLLKLHKEQQQCVVVELSLGEDALSPGEIKEALINVGKKCKISLKTSP